MLLMFTNPPIVRKGIRLMIGKLELSVILYMATIGADNWRDQRKVFAPFEMSIVATLPLLLDVRCRKSYELCGIDVMMEGE